MVFFLGGITLHRRIRWSSAVKDSSSWNYPFQNFILRANLTGCYQLRMRPALPLIVFIKEAIWLVRQFFKVIHLTFSRIAPDWSWSSARLFIFWLTSLQWFRTILRLTPFLVDFVELFHYIFLRRGRCTHWHTSTRQAWRASSPGWDALPALCLFRFGRAGSAGK